MQHKDTGARQHRVTLCECWATTHFTCSLRGLLLFLFFSITHYYHLKSYFSPLCETPWRQPPFLQPVFKTNSSAISSPSSSPFRLPRSLVTFVYIHLLLLPTFRALLPFSQSCLSFPVQSGWPRASRSGVHLLISWLLLGLLSAARLAEFPPAQLCAGSLAWMCSAHLPFAEDFCCVTAHFLPFRTGFFHNPPPWLRVLSCSWHYVGCPSIDFESTWTFILFHSMLAPYGSYGNWIYNPIHFQSRVWPVEGLHALDKWIHPWFG